MAHIVQCISDHPLREGSSSPVGLLRTLFQPQTQILRQYIVQAELGLTQKPGRPHRVKDVSRPEMMACKQEMQVVVSRMEDDFVTIKSLPQGLEMQVGQWIHELFLPRDRHLQKAEF